ncbi:carcinoembryonic antigen-related cell adhesion molecule 8-like isoform X2 [Molossus molossus]|uniref:carcinoembryonic antigen-related cell adhesion molecule 8-like isoform X2 n=1 Tax=Molossus molossus TaxID=27622 RepID=UPI0017469F1D|nr:carcinoembryonic antigen-related cell adhesion molecule 8-like isoform X2 [Molossus molossus]
MEYLSTPTCRGRVPWQGLLLAGSLLIFWSPPITQQLTVVSIDATEGEDVLLRVHNLPGDLVGYNWFKGENVENENRSIASYVIGNELTVPGPAGSGRETIYPNGSLLFRKVTQEDTGYYTLQAIKRNLRSERGTGRLRVYQLLTPNITTNNSNPEENKDPVVLTCEPWTQNTTYLWLINSQSLPDSTRLQLSSDNRTLTLLHVTRNDTGPYVCESRNPVSAGRSDPFTLNVLYGPDAPVISPPDSHYPTGANLNLSCHAASNPPTQYSWFISSSPPQPTQKLFIPNITANDSGSYTCLAHNPHTGLSRTAVKMITVSDVSASQHPGLSDGAIAGIAIGGLLVVVLGTSLGYFLYQRRTRKASDPHGLREHPPPASTPGQGPSGTSAIQGPPPGSRTAGPIYQELLHPNTDVYCRINPTADGTS